MQSVSSRIWTRVAVSISYDDNHDTTGTSEVEGSMGSNFHQESIDDFQIALGESIPSQLNFWHWKSLRKIKNTSKTWFWRRIDSTWHIQTKWCKWTVYSDFFFFFFCF